MKNENVDDILNEHMWSDPELYKKHLDSKLTGIYNAIMDSFRHPNAVERKTYNKLPFNIDIFKYIEHQKLPPEQRPNHFPVWSAENKNAKYETLTNKQRVFYNGEHIPNEKLHKLATAQFNRGYKPDQKELDAQVKAGKLTHVTGYQKEDGSIVRGYYHV